jgi:hypothetical protein
VGEDAFGLKAIAKPSQGFPPLNQIQVIPAGFGNPAGAVEPPLGSRAVCDYCFTHLLLAGPCPVGLTSRYFRSRRQAMTSLDSLTRIKRRPRSPAKKIAPIPKPVSGIFPAIAPVEAPFKLMSSTVNLT